MEQKIILRDLPPPKRSTCRNFFIFHDKDGNQFLALRNEKYARGIYIPSEKGMKQVFSFAEIQDLSTNPRHVQVCTGDSWYDLNRKTLSFVDPDIMEDYRSDLSRRR